MQNCSVVTKISLVLPSCSFLKSLCVMMKRQPCNIPISQFRGKWPTQLLSLRTTAPCLPFEGRQHGALHRSPFPKRGKCPRMERSLFLRWVFFFQDSVLWRLKCIHQRLLHILPPAQLPGQWGCLSREAEARVSLVWPLSWPWWSQRTTLSLSFLTCKTGSSGSSLRSPLAESLASHLTRSRFPGLCCHQHSDEGPKAEFVNPSTSWTYLFSLLEAKYKKKKGS